jgi:glycosyltransferase involved in cell wall biosynthesis
MIWQNWKLAQARRKAIRNKILKVVHLSTSREGGAGIAAKRLHEGLQGLGIDSKFLSLYRKNSRYAQSEIAVTRTLHTKLISGAITWINSILSSRTYFTIIGASPLNSKSLLRFGSQNEVIFHVHNWFNLIDLKEIERALNNGYKFVFTLHDQRLFTGGCHYSHECTKFASSCESCPLLPSIIDCIPSKKLNASREIFQKYKNQIEIIAPSQWIKTLASSSSALKNNAITFIPNWHGNFEPEIQRADTVNYFQEKTIFLGVASINKNSNIKGKDIVVSLESLISKNSANIKIIYLADFKTKEQQTHSFWRRIDYLLVPSKSDNSPNVIHEAKILGVPVIATAVGGIGELLNSEYDHLVDFSFNTPNLIWNIVKNLNKPLSKEVMNKIKLDYNLYVREVLIQHREIYMKLSQQEI